MIAEKFDRAHRSEVSTVLRETVRVMRAKEMLVYASAISFRVIAAAIPATFFVIALLGALQVEELWQKQAVPEIRDNVSQPLFEVINDAVTRVIERETKFWMTIGAVIAIFGIASVVDAVTRTLNQIHEVHDSRRLLERAINSVLIGVASGTMLLGAIAVIRLGPLAFSAVLGDGIGVDVLSFLVRWSIAAGLLTLVVILMVRVAPDIERPVRRVTLDAVVTVSVWILTSLIFGFYLKYIAAYDSILGGLATVYIAVQYVALSAIVFIAGLVIDRVAVERQKLSSLR